MTGYRPISKLGEPDPDLDTLHADVMPWMVTPLLHWLEAFLWVRPDYSGRKTHNAFVDPLEMALRLRQPFERKYPSSASKDIEQRVAQGGSFGLDVAGFALYHYAAAKKATELNTLLHLGGSAWEVTSEPNAGTTKL